MPGAAVGIAQAEMREKGERRERERGEKAEEEVKPVISVFSRWRIFFPLPSALLLFCRVKSSDRRNTGNRRHAPQAC